MAGNYPDSPSWRMAYDRDGSTVFHIGKTGVYTEATSAQKIAINDEAGGSWATPGQSTTAATIYAGIVFPESRDLDGYWLNATVGANNYTAQVQVSTNTTNGQDGTWTNMGTSWVVSQVALPAKPSYRNNIISNTSFGVRGIRVMATGNGNTFDIFDWHLYGEPVPGANPNRLELWHPTLDEKLPPAYLDWGDVPRSSSADRLFRVKNLSASQTAGQTRVALEALTDATPSVPAQHTLSYAGGSFLAQVNIGDLGPGAISGPVTLRRITPSNAVLGLWSFRVFAESTAWA